MNILRAASLPAIGAALAFLTTGAVGAAEPVANIGTLTCIASPGEKEQLGPERELSCSFDPLQGPKAQLKGVVKQIGGQATPGDAKIVLVWSVLGPEIGGPASQLEGRYIGAYGEGRGANATGLVGGESGSIALRPLNLDPNVGENAALVVLELELSAMKA
jgi:hypothetical protein